MKYAIKSLSVYKDNIRYEIHRIGCCDIYKDEPIQVNIIEAESPEEFIKSDVEGDDFESHRHSYRIMPCNK